MHRIRQIVIMIIVSLAIVSCDDDIFGPRSLAGTWLVTENSAAFGRQTFPVGIRYLSEDKSGIIIDNFSNLDLGVEVVADVDGLSITIPQQTVRDTRNNNYRISGNGTATSNMRRINWNYRIDSDDYTAVFEYQN